MTQTCVSMETGYSHDESLPLEEVLLVHWTCTANTNSLNLLLSELLGCLTVGSEGTSAVATDVFWCLTCHDALRWVQSQL